MASALPHIPTMLRDKLHACQMRSAGHAMLQLKPWPIPRPCRLLPAPLLLVPAQVPPKLALKLAPNPLPLPLRPALPSPTASMLLQVPQLPSSWLL